MAIGLCVWAPECRSGHMASPFSAANCLHLWGRVPCLPAKGMEGMPSLQVFSKKPLSFWIRLCTSSSCKNIQMLQGQTALLLTRTGGNYPFFSQLFITGEGVQHFHSLLVFTHTRLAGRKSSAHSHHTFAVKPGHFPNWKHVWPPPRSRKIPLLLLHFVASLEHWCLEVVMKAATLSYSVATYLCLLKQLFAQLSDWHGFPLCPSLWHWDSLCCSHSYCFPFPRSLQSCTVDVVRQHVACQ